MTALDQAFIKAYRSTSKPPVAAAPPEASSVETPPEGRAARVSLSETQPPAPHMDLSGVLGSQVAVVGVFEPGPPALSGTAVEEPDPPAATETDADAEPTVRRPHRVSPLVRPLRPPVIPDPVSPPTLSAPPAAVEPEPITEHETPPEPESIASLQAEPKPRSSEVTWTLGKGFHRVDPPEASQPSAPPAARAAEVKDISAEPIEPIISPTDPQPAEDEPFYADEPLNEFAEPAPPASAEPPSVAETESAESEPTVTEAGDTKPVATVPVEDPPPNDPKPAPPTAFRPLLQVDRFAWPRVCQRMGQKAADELNGLAEQLIAARDRGTRLIGMLGCQSGDGTSTTLLCAARQLAQRGASVAVLDANPADPQLARRLGLLPEHGLEDLLAGRQPLDEVAIESAADRVTLIPLMAPAPEHLDADATDRLSRSLETLAASYDVVLVDLGCLEKSPLVGGTTLGALSAQPAGLVLVQHDETNTEDRLNELRPAIDSSGVELLGLIQNFRREQSDH